MAASANYLDLNPDDDFFLIRQYLFEQGAVLNDLIALKQTQVIAFASCRMVQQANAALKDYIERIFPEQQKLRESEDARIKALMKELEETIVIIDRETIQEQKKKARKKLV